MVSIQVHSSSAKDTYGGPYSSRLTSPSLDHLHIGEIESTMYVTSLLALVLPSLALCELLRSPSHASRPLPPPLLIWHGLGDSYDADGLSSVGELAQEVNPGTYVYNIRLANDSSADRRATFFGNLTEQIAAVCADLSSHPVLNKFPVLNALGFSQGGQFLRAYIEKCNNPPVRNLVTFGSQHNGINKFQDCGATDWLCKGAQGLLNSNTWSGFVQGNLVPAQYFRDPEDLESYLENSNWLADVNNERPVKHKGYRKGIESMNKFVMYVFEDDKTVHPKQSGWFAEVNETTGEVTPLQKRQLYKEDWLGLKKLDEQGRLVFKTTPGEHMRLDENILRETFREYYAPVPEEGRADSRAPLEHAGQEVLSDGDEAWPEL